jgi:uncharacterized protein (UPF0261 family)
LDARGIAIIATLDTKSGEAALLRRRIEDRGWLATVIDVGLGEAPEGLAHYSADEVARAGGARAGGVESVAGLRQTARRDVAMRVMGEGAGKILLQRLKDGLLPGVIAVGGNQGTAIASIAMRALPIGPPKLIVSTVASGNVRGYVGDSDIAMFFSVGDLLGGPNPVIERVLEKAVAAVVGMAEAEEMAPASPVKSVAITAFGNTHQAVVAAMRKLAEAGRSVVPFHASGACGSAMERLIRAGEMEGVLDLTTHELLGELYPEDIYAPVRPGRLTAAGDMGIPQVIVPGGLEYFCFGAAETIPERLCSRPTHHHNPYNTNVRASAEELRRVADLMAERLNAARGPVAVLVPNLGWSEVGSPGGILHDPEANAAFVETLKLRLHPGVMVDEVDATINAPTFANLAADAMLELLEGQGTGVRARVQGA